MILVLHPVVLKERSREPVRESARRSSFNGIPMPEITTFPKKNGVPQPFNDFYHWSVSYAEKYTAGVVAPFPVGIDIEQVKPRNPTLLKRYAPELRMNQSAVDFYKVWTAKEATVKATQDGFKAIGDCTYDASRILTAGQIWYIYSMQFGEFVVSLASIKHDLKIIWGIEGEGFNSTTGL